MSHSFLNRGSFGVGSRREIFLVHRFQSEKRVPLEIKELGVRDGPVAAPRAGRGPGYTRLLKGRELLQGRLLEKVLEGSGGSDGHWFQNRTLVRLSLINKVTRFLLIKN